MTILHSGDHNFFKIQSLSENLAIYNKHTAILLKEESEKYDDILSSKVIYRYLFCYFLDLDPTSYECLMQEYSSDFFTFFCFLQAFLNCPTDINSYVSDIVVLFTRLYQHHPNKWANCHQLIKHLILDERDPFWIPIHQTDNPVVILPTEKYKDEKDGTYSFFKSFNENFIYFINRMDTISFIEWQDVFDLFHKNFPKCHFLCLMEMTEEYFSKIDYMNKLYKDKVINIEE